MFKFLKKAFQDFTDKALKPEKLRPTENSTLVEKSEPSKPVEVQKLDAKTSFLESITKAVTETKISEDYFEKIFQDLEIELIQNNVAYDIIEKIKIRLNKQLVGKSVKRSELSGIIKKELRTLILEILELPTPIAIDTFIEKTSCNNVCRNKWPR